MPTLYLTVGPPGSGKSTWAKGIRNVYRISQDDMGKEQHFDNFLYALEAGNDIVVDRMNFDKAQRKRYVDPAIRHGYRVECFVFHTPSKVCLERMEKRHDHPTIKDMETARKVVNFFFQKYEKPTPDEGFSLVHSIQYCDKSKNDCIIVDLDGTLCNIDHRLHHVRTKPKNWPGFLAGLKDDKLNIWCYDIIANMQTDNDIILCSGRGEEYREATEKWLDQWPINYKYLFMRPAGDHRDDSLIKETILDFQILPQYTPLFAIDDRQRVVDMWRRRGITTLQCAKGDF